VQSAAFGYFVRAVNPANGLVADTSRKDSPVSIAVVSFALAAYPAAVECVWMTRAGAVARSTPGLAGYLFPTASCSSTWCAMRTFSALTSNTGRFVPSSTFSAMLPRTNL